MRCNFTGRPSGLAQPFTPCPCGVLRRCHTTRHPRLKCDAATPPESSSAGGGGGSSSSRITPRTQPLKQALPGYVPATTTDQQQQQQQQPPSPSTSTAAAGISSQQLSSNGVGSLEPGGWDWWTAYFNAMDDTVRELDGIDEELDTAVQEEDYGKAAALRLHQKRLENADCVSAILRDMKLAIEEERYSDAAALRDAGGVGLLGWWAGRAETDDPHGHLIHVSADFGRYVAHAYTGINLAELAGLTDDIGNASGGGGSGGSSATVSYSSSELVGSSSSSSESVGPARESLGEDTDPGAPVFEVFVRNDIENPKNFIQQATALHAPASALAYPAVLDDLTELLAQQVGENASVSVERGTGEDGVGYVRINVSGVPATASATTDDGVDAQDSSSSEDDEDEDDALMDIEPQAYASGAANEVESEETIHTIDDLMKLFDEQEKAEEENSENSEARARTSSDDTTRSPADDMVDAWVEIDGRLKKMRLEEVVAGAVGAASGRGGSGNNTTSNEDDEDDDTKATTIEIGDTLSEMGLGAVAQRVPAAIEWAGRDAFTFVVAEDLKLFEDKDEEEEGSSTAASSSTTSVEVVDVSENEEDNGIEIVDLTPQQEQQEEEDKNFNEATEAKKSGKRPAFSGKLDEIDSIVRSAMGQAIAEGIGATSPGAVDGILGLSGRINYSRIPLNDPPTDVFSGLYLGTFGPHGPEVLRVARTTIEGEEWVQGTKLTGDPNVPAGKVSFRARIGVGHRLSPSGVYPPEYGVQQRYKGQGRVAREGYSAAKWVDGELLTFSASNPMTRGAEVGFVFNIDASRKYLLLFTKVKLDKILPRY